MPPSRDPHILVPMSMPTGLSIRFPSKKTPGYQYYKVPNITTGRDLSPVLVGLDQMDRSEIKEYAHRIRERLGRDDITQEEIERRIEAKLKEPEPPKVSIKPWWAERRRRQGLRY